MNQDTYDNIKKLGICTVTCDICQSITEFTHDQYGIIFCTSCGIEPEVNETRGQDHGRGGPTI